MGQSLLEADYKLTMGVNVSSAVVGFFYNPTNRLNAHPPDTLNIRKLITIPMRGINYDTMLRGKVTNDLSIYLRSFGGCIDVRDMLISKIS